MVNCFELTITHEETGKVLYHNAWVTNHTLSSRNVAQLSQLGRARWKVENENINVLKTKGYNLNHNWEPCQNIKSPTNGRLFPS